MKNSHTSSPDRIPPFIFKKWPIKSTYSDLNWQIDENRFLNDFDNISSDPNINFFIS
jgi:hypothetical protein